MKDADLRIHCYRFRLKIEIRVLPLNLYIKWNAIDKAGMEEILRRDK